MSQQVLARKWRPRSFTEMVGQGPVVQALTNALNQNRLHHAYLFTGTRGVGKTSLARLFAKCLNCERGISATPCEQCGACQAISQGRFFDLLEIDAASRTKIEDTRELLDNVQYAPTQGRFKVYLIDEVHMLSNHSFNALLKTLEEPPPHVKFLLATTDPQRLPVTILSRCLQFHLRNLLAEQIIPQLSKILDHEQIPYEAQALTYIAEAAQGSMRDALSLLDQAIAFSNNHLSTAEVKTLLGKTEPELLLSLLYALANRDSQQLLQALDEITTAGVDPAMAMEELLTLLHQLSLQQIAPELRPSEYLAELAKRLPPEEVQLYYQIGLIGRRDLPLAPTPRIGFEMLLLRMFAFKPQSMQMKQTNEPSPIVTASPTQASKPAPTTSPVKPPSPSKEGKWEEILQQLNLHGVAHVVASHCALDQLSEQTIHLLLDASHAPMFNKTIEQRIGQALNVYFQKTFTLKISIVQSTSLATPASLDQAKQEQRQSQAMASITNDSNIHNLMDQFNAQILPNSIKIKDNSL